MATERCHIVQPYSPYAFGYSNMVSEFTAVYAIKPTKRLDFFPLSLSGKRLAASYARNLRNSYLINSKNFIIQQLPHYP